jgi:hypothetical protein
VSITPRERWVSAFYPLRFCVPNFQRLSRTAADVRGVGGGELGARDRLRSGQLQSVTASRCLPKGTTVASGSIHEQCTLARAIALGLARAGASMVVLARSGS